MLYILQEYFFKKFLAVLIFALIGFMALVVIIDMVDNIDRFLDRNATGRQIFAYYSYWAPTQFVRVVPVAMLLAVLFATASLVKYNELVAIRSSGFGLFRLFWPVFLFSLFLAGLVFLMGEFVVPFSSSQSEYIKKIEIEKQAAADPEQASVFLAAPGGWIFYFGGFDPNEKKAYTILAQRFEKGRLVEVLEAEALDFSGKYWVLQQGRHRHFPKERKENFTTFARFEMLDMTTSPAKLLRRREKPDQMTFAELSTVIAQKKRAGQPTVKEEVGLHMKISLPLLNALIVFIGAPIAVKIRKSGFALNFIIAVAIAFLGIVLFRLAQTLGETGSLPVIIAAWGVDVLFFISGLSLLFWARR
ncbi:MAG TPA: LptF/LptG family permease [candidate division Zixibacteria bacterium]|nr:LptF/LptG family permease [candidate division Zixibacteria bacterium]